MTINLRFIILEQLELNNNFLTKLPKDLNKFYFNLLVY